MVTSQPQAPTIDSPHRLRSLRAALFRYTLAPTLILAVALCLVFSFQQMHDRRELLLSHGRASAEQLVALIQLSEGNTLDARLEWLQQSLMTLMLEKDMIRSVQIYRGEPSAVSGREVFKLLSRVGPRPRTDFSSIELDGKSAHIYEDVNSLQVLQPLLSRSTHCWLAIELHRPYFIVGTYRIVLITLLICGCIALIWVIFLAERASHNLARFGQALQAIGRGRFNTRVTEFHNRELFHFSKNINKMARNLANHQRENQESHHQAIEDLRHALDKMEEQNIELDMARKEAIEDSRGKSTFLANTSHEIRTPLNGILGFTNLLLKTEIDELQRDYLQTILYSSENLLTTINDILDFSRIESGNLVLDHIPMNLGQLVEETLQILAPQAYEQDLELVPLIDPQLPTTLIGDPLRIKQILTNLVSNAVHSSERGNIPVSVSVQTGKETEIWVRISITDIGNRIDEQGRQALLQLVRSANLHQRQQLTSNGIGLAIARSLIETMRGSIDIDETAGEGRVVWFHIPLVLDRNHKNLPREQFPDCRLLLADPNPATRLQVVQLLKLWQIEPVVLNEAQTLQPSVEQMWRQDSLPDLVIIDTALAKGDFEPFIGMVQQLVDLYLCRVIIQGAAIDMRRCYSQLRTRVLAFMSKPVSQAGLLRALKRAAPPRASERISSESQPSQGLPNRPTVLAVDDHKPNRHLIGELLRTQNIAVVVAAGGEQALQLWRQQKFDMILMDIQMPQPDGIKTTGCIRAEETGRRTPIIALTAHVGAEEKAKLLAAGFDDYLSKPVSEAQLRHTIKRWMNIQIPLATDTTIPSYNLRLVDIGESIKACNNDARIARDLLGMLVKGLPDDELALNCLAKAVDHKGLFELIHRMHGGCCYCGVPRLHHAIGKLQEELRPLQDQLTAKINQKSVQSVAKEIRALRDWEAQQDLDGLFGLKIEVSKEITASIE